MVTDSLRLQCAEMSAQMVARNLGYSWEAMCSRKRDRKIAAARRRIAAVLTEMGLGRSEVGRILGRDHSTVLWELRKG